MILSRYRIPAIMILFGALLIAFLIIAITGHIAHADPVGAVVTAPAVVEVTSWAMFAVGALTGIVTVLAAVGALLHFVAPRTKNTYDDRAAVWVDRMETVGAEVLAALRAFVPGNTVVQKQPASPVTVNVHPAAATMPTDPTTSPERPSMKITTPGTVLALLLFFALSAAGSGCAATSRATALQAAQVGANAASAAFVLYDKNETSQIAADADAASKKATTFADGSAAIAAGRAKLAVYLAKRAPIDKALLATYSAIAIAATLNDDPSLAGAQKALARLVSAVAELTGGGK
jgi:hypothetical protein